MAKAQAKTLPVKAQPEQTGQQSLSVSFMGDYAKRAPATYATYRKMRKDPTIALARALLAAPVITGAWSVEADEDTPDDVVEFIQTEIIPHRYRIMEAAVYGGMDFGWQGFELVYGVRNGLIGLDKVKPLLHDMTDIMIDPVNGDFAGYKQKGLNQNEIRIAAEYCLHIGFRVEGTQWDGQSLLENSREAWERWTDAAEGSARYDRKVAGSHFVIYYPPGTSLYKGTQTDNSEIAAIMLKALESSGSISIPNLANMLNQDSGDTGWKIDILQDSGGRQPTFVEGMRYLDVNKVRGLLAPERSILEGQFGTKAEAGEHADMAITQMQIVDNYITAEVNRQAVIPLLRRNFGEDMERKARIEAAPLTDKRRDILTSLYASIMANPTLSLEEFGSIDTDAIKDTLDIPKTDVVAVADDPGNHAPEDEEIEAANRLNGGVLR